MKKIKSASIFVCATLVFGIGLFSTNDERISFSVNAAVSVSKINISDVNDAALGTYYSSVQGLSGNDLQSALHNVINNHTAYSYSDTVNIMKITDRDWTKSPLSDTELINYPFTTHTGIGDPYLKLLYGTNYNGTSNAVKWSEDHVKIWNKEHTWAKSHGDFGENAPAGTDLHHLIAADAQLNRYHSNYDYGIPETAISIRSDVRDLPTTGQNGKNADSPNTNVFLPPIEDRGDIARALFYMETRYYEYVSEYDPKLELVDEITSATHKATSSKPGKMGWRKVLLQWHHEDPVDEYEIHRNNLIYNNFQGNRNPFIDHPEYADLIYGGKTDGASITGACTKERCEYYEPSTAELASVEISKSSGNTFFINSVYNRQGLDLIITLEDGTTFHASGHDEAISTNYDGITLDTLGNYTVNVSYTRYDKTMSASYTIIVEDAPLESAVNHVLINQVYASGGDSNSLYKKDFIELYNPTYMPIDIGGYSLLRYTANGDAYGNPTNISSGSVPALGYFLVSEGGGNYTTGKDLPKADTIGSNNYGATGGSVELLDDEGEPVDLVGWGDGKKYQEKAASTPSATKALKRIDPNVNNKDNRVDFSLVTPSPTNSAMAYVTQFETQVALNPNPYCDKSWGYLDDNYLAVINNGHTNWFYPSSEAEANYLYLLSYNKNLPDFLERVVTPIKRKSLNHNNLLYFVLVLISISFVIIGGFISLKYRNKNKI